MIVKGVNDYDIVNYKLPSMYIAFPKCSFKCGREICQNRALAQEKDIEIEVESLVSRYISNLLTKAVVCGGLEPFDSFDDLFAFVKALRNRNNKDTVVIYSGYEEDDIWDKIEKLIRFPNIIVKFGKYLPQEKPYFNEELGVELVGRNQYVVRYVNDYKAKSGQGVM